MSCVKPNMTHKSILTTYCYKHTSKDKFLPIHSAIPLTATAQMVLKNTKKKRFCQISRIVFLFHWLLVRNINYFPSTVIINRKVKNEYELLPFLHYKHALCLCPFSKRKWVPANAVIFVPWFSKKNRVLLKRS